MISVRALVLLPLALLAWVVAPTVQAVALKDYPELVVFIDEISEKHGFAPAALREIFARARIHPEILETIERPREALPWHEYNRGFLTQLHIKRGLQYWRKHAALLARAQQQYGVPPEIIVAVLGVETHYGRNNGRYLVIDSLTTLTLAYPRRSAFFRRELEEYLVLTRELGLDPLEIKGSYAGAMGASQFIASSYRRYAVDFDADGRLDLLSSPADVIGSVANFLKVHGWETDQPITDDAQVEGALYSWIEELGVKPVLSVRHLINYGIFPRERQAPDKSAALIVLEGETGPIYRIGYNNFYVITRYNRSKRYAMTVYELARIIRQRYQRGP